MNSSQFNGCNTIYTLFFPITMKNISESNKSLRVQCVCACEILCSLNYSWQTDVRCHVEEDESHISAGSLSSFQNVQLLVFHSPLRVTEAALCHLCETAAQNDNNNKKLNHLLFLAGVWLLYPSFGVKNQNSAHALVLQLPDAVLALAIFFFSIVC